MLCTATRNAFEFFLYRRKAKSALVCLDGAAHCRPLRQAALGSPTSIDAPPERSSGVHLHLGMRPELVCLGGGAKPRYETLLDRRRGSARGRSGLAIMNKACKSGYHAWCSQISSIRHHVKHG